MEGDACNLEAGIFPEEVWEVILGKLDDSQDVLKTFDAYPILRDRVLKNKYWWLIDQVMPHICPWITKKELLSFRLVCKKWCHGVGNYLENHPARRAYDHEKVITGQLWVQEASPKYEFYYRSYRAYNENNMDYINIPPLRDFNLANIGIIQKLDKDMATHPPTRNPFVGRSIIIDDRRMSYQLNRAAEIHNFWGEAVKFLRKYGDHVWFLCIKYSEKEDHPICFYQRLFQLLSCVSNLKSLKIVTYTDLETDLEIETFLHSQAKAIPHLPQLETLNLACDCGSKDIPDCLVKFFIASYSGQIRRLKVNMSQYREFHGIYYPELTEFSTYGYESQHAIAMVLACLAYPKLWRFEMDWYWPLRPSVSHLALLDKIGSLSRCQRINTVVICRPRNSRNRRFSGVEFYVDPEDSPSSKERYNYVPITDDIFPTVKSLIMYCCINDLKIGFLEGFPNLEHLKVYAPKQHYGDGFYNRELMCGQNKNVWRFPMLPKLQTFYAEGETESDYYRKWYRRSPGGFLIRVGIPLTNW